MVSCEALFRCRISELDAHSRSRRFAMSYKKMPCLMSYAGLQAEFSFLALHRRRPLVSNSSLERTFRANVVPAGKPILAKRRSTQSR